MRLIPAARGAYAALSGLLSAGLGLAAALLVAAIVRPESSPLVTIGGTIIDATPTPVKEFAVRTVGTRDKPLLLLGIGVVLALLAMAAGVLASRRPLAGLGVMGLLGVAGVVSALTRPAAQPFDAVPALVAGVVAVATLAYLTRRLPASPATAAGASPATAAGGAPGTAAGTAAAAPQDPAWISDSHVILGQDSGDSPDPNGILGRETLGRAGAGDAGRGDAGRGAAGRGDAGRGGGVGSRRRFLVAAGIVGGSAVVAGSAAGLIQRAKGGAAARSRENLVLPAPKDPAGPRVTTPDFYTPPGKFYRVDTALTVPQVDADRWRLTVHGLVDRPFTLDLGQLLDRGLIERDITLNCVSNEVGGPYIGTTRWLGVPVAGLLRAAGVRSGADQVIARSVDGMTIGTPTEVLLDGRDAMLAVAMDGRPLPPEHGYPVRMLTPGLYGYAGSCKWVTALELSTFDAYDAYWVKRGWARRAPVKTGSRIDKPAPFATGLTAGPVTVAGVAWAQHRGVRAVEVQADDGPWMPAELLPVPSTDTWVQWRLTWQARSGGHTLRVRATDATGAVQPERRQTPFPDGATGWHTLSVMVG